MYGQEPVVITDDRAGAALDEPVPRCKEPDAVTDADVPPPEEIIRYEKDPSTRIATITIDRPDQLNSTTIGARRRYGDLIFKASIDDDVKVLVVRGVGDHLGTGADLDELMAKRAAGTALHEEFGIDRGRGRHDAAARARTGPARRSSTGTPTPRSGCRSLQDFKKISILEVKGYCYGWHFYQAADADLVDLVRRRAVRPSRLPLRRLRAAHVAVGDDDGAAQVPGDGVHRPPVHRRSRCTSATS